MFKCKVFKNGALIGFYFEYSVLKWDDIRKFIYYDFLNREKKKNYYQGSMSFVITSDFGKFYNLRNSLGLYPAPCKIIRNNAE